MSIAKLQQRVRTPLRSQAFQVACGLSLVLQRGVWVAKHRRFSAQGGCRIHRIKKLSSDISLLSGQAQPFCRCDSVGGRKRFALLSRVVVANRQALCSTHVEGVAFEKLEEDCVGCRAVTGQGLSFQLGKYFVHRPIGGGSEIPDCKGAPRQGLNRHVPVGRRGAGGSVADCGVALRLCGQQRLRRRIGVLRTFLFASRGKPQRRRQRKNQYP